LGPHQEDSHGDENHAPDIVELLGHHQDQPGGRYHMVCKDKFKTISTLFSSIF